MAELAHQPTQGRKRQPNHATGRSLNVINKRPRTTVNREPARELQRLARGNVGLQFGVGHILGERHRRRVNRPSRATHLTPGVIDEPVTRVQHARAAAVLLGAQKSDVWVVRLSEDLTVEQKRTVTAEHQPIDLPRTLGPIPTHHIFGFQPAEIFGQLNRGEPPADLAFQRGNLGRLINLRRKTHRFDARCAKHGEPGR